MQTTPFKLLIPVLLIVLATPISAQSANDRYTIHLDGLACPFCAYGIEKQLMKIDGVETLETDIEKGTVLIEMTVGQVLEKGEVQQAVDDAGFTLKGFEPAGADPDNPGP